MTNEDLVSSGNKHNELPIKVSVCECVTQSIKYAGKCEPCWELMAALLVGWNQISWLIL